MSNLSSLLVISKNIGNFMMSPNKITLSCHAVLFGYFLFGGGGNFFLEGGGLNGIHVRVLHRPHNMQLFMFRIPVLFSTIGTFGRILCVLFFACLSIAGVTSLVANMEMVTHTLYDFGGNVTFSIVIM